MLGWIDFEAPMRRKLKLLILLVFCLVLLTIAGALTLTQSHYSPLATPENYDEVKLGVSIDEAHAILGDTGWTVLTPKLAEIYCVSPHSPASAHIWETSDTTAITVWFDPDTRKVISTQIGIRPPDMPLYYRILGTVRSAWLRAIRW
jgi:hypothetical protein